MVADYPGVFTGLRAYSGSPGFPGVWCMVACLGRDHAQGDPYGHG